MKIIWKNDLIVLNTPGNSKIYVSQILPNVVKVNMLISFSCVHTLVPSSLLGQE